MTHPAILHFVFESLAYLIGSFLYLKLRRRDGDHLADADRSAVFAAAIVGAALGSKVLGWLEHPVEFVSRWRDPFFLLSGKTIVGGLIGGWIAVEWIKRKLGILQRSGDLFAIPLCIGIAIGRIGCFLGGVEDGTYGIVTSVPWAVDFGDGLRRHATQLYEVLWLLMLASWIGVLRNRPHLNGDLFKVFMIGYMTFRLAVDFLKPAEPVMGLTAIQWACVATLFFYVPELPRLSRQRG